MSESLALAQIAEHLENAKKEYEKAAKIADEHGLMFYYDTLPSGGCDGGFYFSPKYVENNPERVEEMLFEPSHLEGWHSSSESCD